MSSCSFSPWEGSRSLLSTHKGRRHNYRRHTHGGPASPAHYDEQEGSVGLREGKKEGKEKEIQEKEKEKNKKEEEERW